MKKMSLNIQANFGKRPIPLSAHAQINSAGELLLYGVIGDWFDGLDPLTIIRELDSMPGDEIVVRFHTPGGNLVDGLPIYNELKNTKKRVVGYVDGIAASMGCAIAMACDHLYIPSNAMMMVHLPNLENLKGQLNAVDLRKIADQLDTLKPSYIQMHMDKTGKSFEEIDSLISDGENHFFRGQEAVDYGLADEVIGAVEVAAHWKEFDFSAIQTNAFLPAAAAAPTQPKVNSMFKLKGSGGALLVTIAAVLKSEYPTVEAAATALEVEEDFLKGEKDLTQDALAKLCTAFGLQAPVSEQAPAQVDTGATTATAQQDATALTSAVAKETKRVQDIYAVSAKADVSDDVRNNWISTGASIDSVRAQAFDHVTATNNDALPSSNFVRGPSARSISTDLTNALLARSSPDKHEYDEHSGAFRGMSLMEMAKCELESRGEKARGLDVNQVMAAVFHTTSDFPIVLEDVARKEMLGRYQEEPRTFPSIARRATASDFKQKNVITVGSGSGLRPLKETGELESGTFSEAKASYKLETFGRKFSFTREMFINDDLGVFTGFMAQVGSLASRLESDVFWALFTQANLQFNEENLFSTDRNTRVTGAAGTMEAGLTAMKKAMRTQKELDGQTINVVPRTLLVSPSREVAAMKILTSVQGTKTNDVNVFSNSMNLVVESRLDGRNNDPYYTVADPNAYPVFEYCYLNGNEQPFIETEQTFGTRGMTLAIAHDFAAGVVGGLGICENSGS